MTRGRPRIGVCPPDRLRSSLRGFKLLPLEGLSDASAHRKVLVIDDDPLVLHVTAKRLREEGFDVSTRMEALGTMQAVTAEHPDVVLIDVNMPALTGDSLVELMRSNAATKDVPIILHSSEPLALLQAMALRVGAVGAISKSDDDDAFKAQFNRLCCRKPATKPITGKPNADRPTTGKSTSGRPTTGRPSTGKPSTGLSSSERPATGRPITGRPIIGRAAGERPTTERPLADASPGDRPITARPKTPST